MRERKAQLGVELLLLLIAVLGVVGTYSVIAKQGGQREQVEYAVSNILEKISGASESVALMGYPARESFQVYVPLYIDAENSYISDSVVNYAILGESNKSVDYFDIYDYCIQGELPVEEGYYTITVAALQDCILVTYNEAFINPQSITRVIELGDDTNVNVEFIALAIGGVNVTLTVQGDVVNITDLDAVTPGRQTSMNLGSFEDGELINNSITFYGDAEGTYEGYLYYNEYRVPVTIIVIPRFAAVLSAGVDVNEIEACDTVCVSASVINGTNPISQVWVELKNSEGESFNYTLSDTTCDCCGVSSDGLYGASIQLGGYCCGSSEECCTLCSCDECNFSTGCPGCNYNNTDCGYTSKSYTYDVEYEAESGKYDEVKLEAREPGLGDDKYYETDIIEIEVKDSNGWVNAAMKSASQGEWHNYTSECDTYYDNITGFRMTLYEIQEGVCGENQGSCDCNCDGEGGCQCQCSEGSGQCEAQCQGESQCSYNCQHQYRCRCRCRGGECDCDCGFSEENCTYYKFEVSSDCNAHALSNIDFEFGEGAVVNSPTGNSYTIIRYCGAGNDTCGVSGCEEGYTCSGADDTDESILYWTLNNAFANDTQGYEASLTLNPPIIIQINCTNN